MIFVDTGFWLALWSERDPDHARVVETLAAYQGQRLSDLLVTSNHVVFETLTLAQARAGHQLAVAAGKQLYSEKLASIHWSVREDEESAFAYLARHEDKGYSAVDCLSFVIMERLGIHEAFAIDRHFTHRFTARPGPR